MKDIVAFIVGGENCGIKGLFYEYAYDDANESASEA